MRQLTGLDTQFLAAEDGRNHGHVSAPLFLAGARLQAQYPVSMVMDGVGVDITVLSYRDSLDVGVVGDRELVPDAGSLIDHINTELTELRQLLDSTKEASSK
jgi:hypothetical protein